MLYPIFPQKVSELFTVKLVALSETTVCGNPNEANDFLKYLLLILLGLSYEFPTIPCEHQLLVETSYP